jgi:hypothetical protein
MTELTRFCLPKGLPVFSRSARRILPRAPDDVGETAQLSILKVTECAAHSTQARSRDLGRGVAVGRPEFRAGCRSIETITYHGCSSTRRVPSAARLGLPGI